MRERVRRFTRLTTSKKIDTTAMPAPTMFYNFCRESIRRHAPAMAAGVTGDKLWNMEDIIALMDARDEQTRKNDKVD